MKGKLNKKVIGKFIEDSVKEVLMNQKDGLVCRYILDDDLCLYVGWEYGFDKNNGYDGWEVCAKIAERNDWDWSDMEYLNMPYADDGNVWDTDCSDPSAKDAAWYIEEYKNIRAAMDKGEYRIG